MKSIPGWPMAPIKLQALIDAGADEFERQQLFFGHGTDNARDEALWLALHALGLSWGCDQGELQKVLSQAEVEAITTLFSRRVETRQPAAYLTGRGYFAGLEFRVTADVLVPRSPIAELVANQFQPWLISEPDKILDLCTGSGCIGIACAYAFVEAQVDCSDVSLAALAVARQNVADHKLSRRVNVLHSDLFQSVSGPYDLIVSNPPYVDAQDMAAMPAEFHAEPELGLAAGQDGLDICRRILREAEQYMTDTGCLIVEVGNSWQALEQAFPEIPFTWIEFSFGGQGVFVMTTAELKRYAACF